MSQTQSPIRVLIVDDSAVIRSVIARTLEEQDGVEVVGKAVNGQLGVESVAELNPDIVILDIEMPVMDGITALPLILKEKPGVRVLICSTLSARGADISIKALSLGAADCLLKPDSSEISAAETFKKDLVRVVRGLMPGKWQPKAAVPSAMPSSSQITLRKHPGILAPKILAIGSSTGGPKVLMDVMAGLKDLPIPIVITQHMPKTFTALLAQHIQQKAGIPCVEGQPGDILKPGHAYVAPGGYHMVFEKRGEDVCIQTNEDPPENFCRPSVNPMLRSLLPIYKDRILCVILTGMGNDGSQVCEDLVKQGGQVIAQDEATSVVWGMPGAVATAGLCSAVLPDYKISEKIRTIVQGHSL